MIKMNVMKTFKLTTIAVLSLGLLWAPSLYAAKSKGKSRVKAQSTFKIVKHKRIKKSVWTYEGRWSFKKKKKKTMTMKDVKRHISKKGALMLCRSRHGNDFSRAVTKKFRRVKSKSKRTVDFKASVTCLGVRPRMVVDAGETKFNLKSKHRKLSDAQIKKLIWKKAHALPNKPKGYRLVALDLPEVKRLKTHKSGKGYNHKVDLEYAAVYRID